jgi:hypothetical protein
MEKWGGFEIKKDNVIYVKNDEESLRPLVDKLTHGSMHFAEDIEARCIELGNNLPGDFKKQDGLEKTDNHNEFMAMMQLMNETNQ